MGYYVRTFNRWFDLPFALGLFRSPVTRRLMFDDLPAVFSFCLSRKYEAKFICIREKESEKEKVSMATFSRGKGNEYWFSGAIVERYYNSGIGVYACIAMLDNFFRSHPDCVIRSGVFTENTRSLKMLLKVGFEQVEKSDDGFRLRLTGDAFRNDFVEHLKHRYDIH